MTRALPLTQRQAQTLLRAAEAEKAAEIEALRAELAKMKAALEWMRDYDPRLVDAATERFALQPEEPKYIIDENGNKGWIIP